MSKAKSEIPVLLQKFILVGSDNADSSKQGSAGPSSHAHCGHSSAHPFCSRSCCPHGSRSLAALLRLPSVFLLFGRESLLSSAPTHQWTWVSLRKCSQKAFRMPLNFDFENLEIVVSKLVSEFQFDFSFKKLSEILFNTRKL